MATNSKQMRRAPVTRKTLIKRLVLLVILFLAAGSISFPQGANWVIERFNRVAHTNVKMINYPVTLGLDLQGGTRLEYVADLSKVPDAERKDAMDGVRDVIERRVNQMGVAEPLVQTTNTGDEWRLTVELAGVRDVNQAIKMIGETPILEFRVENPDAGRALTEEEQASLTSENERRMNMASSALAEAAKGTALKDVASGIQSQDAQASYLDLGWIATNAETNAFIAESLQGTDAGTIFPQVLDDGNRYLVARVVGKREAAQEVRASHILIQWDKASSSVSTSTKEEARAEAERILAGINAENFEEMARTSSEDPSAKENGGDLGWFRREAMVEPFSNAAFSMKDGEISGIVESPFGFHIIKKTGERTASDIRVEAVAITQKKESDIVDTDPYKRTPLTGQQLDRATLDFDQQTGSAQVVLQFDDEGSKLFADMTRENIGKPIAIYLDGSPISIPTVQQEIPSGQAVISGRFTVQEAKTLAQRLQSGALPVSIGIVAQQSIGPVLGSESVSNSLKAGLIGFALVVVFMILFYRLPGLISVLALAFYSALVFASFKLFHVTLSLSGIAGFILSIGMAVDANVLIFERFKEELRTDKPVGANVDEAFSRAWLSIRDGNVTTLIVCLILYLFTTSLIKGFALTLSIGVLISMFTAITVTKVLFKLAILTPLYRICPWLFLQSRKHS